MVAIVHIDDAVAATVAALTAEPSVYNIVDDNPLPVRQPPQALEPGGNNVERMDIMSQPVNDGAIDFFEIDQDRATST